MGEKRRFSVPVVLLNSAFHLEAAALLQGQAAGGCRCISAHFHLQLSQYWPCCMSLGVRACSPNVCLKESGCGCVDCGNEGVCTSSLIHLFPCALAGEQNKPVCSSRCKQMHPWSGNEEKRELQAAWLANVPNIPYFHTTFFYSQSRQSLCEPGDDLFSSWIALCGCMASKWG